MSLWKVAGTFHVSVEDAIVATYITKAYVDMCYSLDVQLQNFIGHLAEKKDFGLNHISPPTATYKRRMAPLRKEMQSSFYPALY